MHSERAIATRCCWPPEKCAVFENRQMREQIELLEDHADLSADLVNRLQVIGKFDAVHEDGAFLVFLQPIDAANHRGFAGTRRATDYDALALCNLQIDVAQYVKLSVPLVDVLHFDVKHLPPPLS